MQEIVSVQWFPGHMAKTRRIMKNCLPQVDLVAEIIDARVPVSSRNPEIDQIVGQKPHIVLLNKADLADPVENQRWTQKFNSRGVPVIAVDCKTGNGLNKFVPKVKEILAEKIKYMFHFSSSPSTAPSEPCSSSSLTSWIVSSSS